ncbi:MAG: DNA-3-methyladenine glycosylase 2 family protein [Oscillospiraceae bacterium]|nr:DNA-3-methyladenine glycosylase 2 family protein [Oscillospiraceae bacterium]
MIDNKHAEFFEYTLAELDALKKKDKKLAAVIESYGVIKRKVNKDLFPALIRSIISQQISGKAADTVENRLLELCEEITPTHIHETDITAIQKCGMSMRKAQYIKEAGEAVYNGAIDIFSLSDMTDMEIISLLSGLPGIGVWTAEMMLIFSLGRMDVLSYGDLAIRRGICKLYGHKALTKEQFDRYKKRYSPYGSIASLYLWRLSVEQ